MKQFLKMFFVFSLISVLAAGCGGGVSEDKPISEIKNETETMSVDKLKNIAAKYGKAIKAKKDELEGLKSKFQDIPVTQMMGEDAKKIKEELSSISESVKALQERLNVYLQALKEK